MGDCDPVNVILLEIDPDRQKTRCDFLVTERLFGVRAVDVRAVRKQGNRLYYERDGRLTPIERIYNRAIVDELERRAIEMPFDFRDDLQVEWAGHPNWFFRLSKFSLPYLCHPAVPRAQFLDRIETRAASRALRAQTALFVRRIGRHRRADGGADRRRARGTAQPVPAAGARGFYARSSILPPAPTKSRCASCTSGWTSCAP